MIAMNLPNGITIFRIALIPIFVALFSTGGQAGAAWSIGIFLFAAITDLLDGYIARRWRQVTRLGELLDPVADKLLIVSALILLVRYRGVAPWIAIIIIGRESLVSALRAVAYRQGIVIAAEGHGKLKFVFQVAAIVLLIPLYAGPSIWRNFGLILLWAAAGLAVISGIQYFVKFWKQTKVNA